MAIISSCPVVKYLPCIDFQCPLSEGSVFSVLKSVYDITLSHIFMTSSSIYKLQTFGWIDMVVILTLHCVASHKIYPL